MSAEDRPQERRAPFVVGEEIRDALSAGRPVVALETSVIGQGLPHPRNLECADRMSAAVRQRGAVPAWVGVVAGSIAVGLSETDLAAIAEPGRSVKVARRDLPIAVAEGSLGATTVSATIWASHPVGIRVGATGGIGGVHHGSGDVSADLLELARTPGLLVCSGPKSIVDPVATAERLEELGVALVGFGTGRLPFFLSRDAGVELAHRVRSVSEAAAIAGAAEGLGARSTIVLCNPVPERHALDPGTVAEAVVVAERAAAKDGVRGAELTPYLLARIAEETDGASTEANLALLESNAGLAGELARRADLGPISGARSSRSPS